MSIRERLPGSALEERLLATVDWDHIDKAAAWVAVQLVERGVAAVRLAPNDATVYPIIVIAWDSIPMFDRNRNPDPYMVTLATGFGRSYPWGGFAMHAGYCADKWADGHVWTGHIVAEFLTALSKALEAQQ